MNLAGSWQIRAFGVLLLLTLFLATGCFTRRWHRDYWYNNGTHDYDRDRQGGLHSDRNADRDHDGWRDADQNSPRYSQRYWRDSN